MAQRGGVPWRTSNRFSWSLGYPWFDTDEEFGSFAYDVGLSGSVTAPTLRF